jgi:hypothetical protein
MDFSETGLPIELKRVRGQKTIRIRVHSQHNRILVTAPCFVSSKVIRQFILSQIEWIRNHFHPIRFDQTDLIVSLWGRPYHLQFEAALKSGFEVRSQEIVLRAPGECIQQSHQKMKWLNRFYLEQMKQVSTPIVLRWQKLMNAPVKTLHFRKMNSRWGSCSPHKGRICLNTELAKYPIQALEYVVVHELTHFFVGDHGQRFKAQLDHYLPQWRTWKQLLDTPDPLQLK